MTETYAPSEASASDALLKRVPPHSVEAERAVLGALLIDPRAVDTVAEVVLPDHFYRQTHATIYQVVLDLWKQDQPIDVVLVNEELDRKGLLDKVGGTAAILDLTETVPTAANAAFYAEIVRDHASRRQVIQVAAEIQKDAFEDTGPTPDLLDRTEKRLFEVTQKRIRSEATPVNLVVQEAFERLQTLRAGGGLAGTPSGFADLDELSQGFQPGEMTILAARPSMGKCLVYDAEVLLDDGSVVTIEELCRRRTGRLLTLADDGHFTPATPSDYVDDGVKPVFRVTTQLGRRVETTLTHPFLSLEGWRPLGELEAGDRIAVPRRLAVFGQGALPEADVRALAARCARAARPSEASLAGPAARVVAHDAPSPAGGVALALPPAVAASRWGAAARRVRRQGSTVPAEVFTLPREQLALFLRLFLSAAAELASDGDDDGRPRLRLVASERLTRQVQHLLLRFGIVAALRETRGGWLLEVRELASLEALLAEVGLEGRDAAVAAARAYLKARSFRREWGRGDLLWDRIVAIEPVGREQVYDLTVPDTHNFVADDVCVHNTSFALNVLRNICLYHGRAGVFFSLEMPKLQVTMNMLCSLAKIDGHRLRGGYLTRDEERQFLDAAEVLAKAPLYIDDTPGLSTMDLRAKGRRLKSQHDIDIIMIDYLQLMSGSSTSANESRQQEVSEISRMTKALARELSIPIIALAQLSRKVEERKDHKPMMSDLRESGCLTGDTLVPLADTGERVAMRDLVGRSGFAVWAMNPATQRIERALVSHAFSTGTKPVLRLTTRLGHTIRATGNHRFFTTDGWRRLDELTPGDQVAVPWPLAAPAPVRATRAGGAGGTLLADPPVELESGVAWDAIAAIEPAGVEEVFDLTVPGPHNFVADDIVVHNSIEQDADLIMLLHRPEYYERDNEDLKNKAELIVAKNRNGPTGDIPLQFFKNQMRFESVTSM